MGCTELSAPNHTFSSTIHITSHTWGMDASIFLPLQETKTNKIILSPFRQ